MAEEWSWPMRFLIQMINKSYTAHISLVAATVLCPLYGDSSVITNPYTNKV